MIPPTTFPRTPLLWRARRAVRGQLDYGTVGDAAPRRDPGAFRLHAPPGEMVYVPPAWEPLYLGSGIGFVAA